MASGHLPRPGSAPCSLSYLHCTWASRPAESIEVMGGIRLTRYLLLILINSDINGESIGEGDLQHSLALRILNLDSDLSKYNSVKCFTIGRAEIAVRRQTEPAISVVMQHSIAYAPMSSRDLRGESVL